MQCNVKSATGRITEEYNFILIFVFGKKTLMQVWKLINNIDLQFYCPPCLPSGFRNLRRFLSPGSNCIKDDKTAQGLHSLEKAMR